MMSRSLHVEEKSLVASSCPQDLSVEEAVGLTIAPRLAEVQQCIAQVLDTKADSIEAIHNLRVSTRRAVAAMEFLRGTIDKGFRRKAIKQLEWVCSRAGRVRDLDVMIERIREQYDPETRLLWKSFMEKREVLRGALETALRKFESKPLLYPHCLEHRRNEWKLALAGSFRRWAQRRIAQLANRFLRLSKHRDRKSRSLHALRIHGRKLRYSLEFLEPITPGIESSSNYLRLRELQQLLGKINDSNVWCKTLKGVRRDCHANCPHRFLKLQSLRRRQKQKMYFGRLDELWSKKEQSVFFKELHRLVGTT